MMGGQWRQVKGVCLGAIIRIIVLIFQGFMLKKRRRQIQIRR
jgi:hypothetical protein